MKVYIILEEDFAKDDSDWGILGVVESEEEAIKLVDELMESVCDHNNGKNRINYCYEDVEVGDLSSINAHIKYNQAERKG